MNTRKNNYGVSENTMDISELEDRTQNIDATQTDNSSTTIDNRLNVITLSVDGEVNLYGQVSIGGGSMSSVELALQLLMDPGDILLVGYRHHAPLHAPTARPRITRRT